MDKYTVIVEQRKTWYGWKRADDVVYCPSHEHALIAVNRLNVGRNRHECKRLRYIIIHIDKV